MALADDPEELAVALAELLLAREREGKPKPSRLACRAVLSNKAGRTITRHEMNTAARMLNIATVAEKDSRGNIVRSTYRLPATLSALTYISDALARARSE
jgi:hypothetical protein